jgi:TusE/DsrC/DsvC family sulfur relay protein
VQDKAFGFYYPDDLLAIKDAGAEIVPINTLRDAVLPNLDGLFIGGGFPEMFMAELEANKSMRASICDAIQSGLPTYAECGGLMYLARTLRWKERSFEMVGALPVDVVMHERPVGRGYVELEPTQHAPWNARPDAAASVRGHEFHYSSLENVPSDLVYAYKVKRGHGIDGANDGICYRNAVASYAHLRSSAGSEWASQFVAFVKKMKTSLASEASTPTRQIIINGKLVRTDAEGYLINIDEWSEDFATASAKVENLELTAAHWQVILFLRTYFEEHQVQAQVRAMIRHFSTVWGAELGNNHHLHTLFPMGGPQKQGNRLAGLLKTKGEH